MVTVVKWSGDGRYLTVGESDGTVRIFEPNGGSCCGGLVGGLDLCPESRAESRRNLDRSVAVGAHPAGTTSSSGGQGLSNLGTNCFTLTRRQSGANNCVLDVLWHANGSYLAVAKPSNSIVWNSSIDSYS